MSGGRLRQGVRLLAGAALLAASSLAHAALCGGIPTGNPVHGGAELNIGNATTVNGSPVTGSGNTLQENGVRSDTTPTYPALVPPTFPVFAAGPNTSATTISAGTYGTVTVNDVAGTPDTVFTGGTYFIKTLDIQTAAVAQLAPGDYYIEDLRLANNAAITVSPAGVVRLYIRNDVSGSNSNGFNAGGVPQNFLVFMYGGSGARFDAGNSAVFNGVVYAPNGARITFGNTATITGAVVSSGRVDIGNTSQLIYTGAIKDALAGISSCVLFAEWRADEAAWTGAAGQVLDTGPNGFHGTALGGATTSSTDPALPGNPGTCRYGVFDGNARVVSLPASYPNFTTDFTISAWIRTTNAASTRHQRIFADDNNSSGGYALSLGDGGAGRLRFFSRGPGLVILDTPTNRLLASNTWYFVAGVAEVSANRMWAYVFDRNGALITSVQIAKNGWGTDAGAPSIGGEATGAEAIAARRFLGDIEEVRIHQGAMDRAALGQLASITRPCTLGGVDHFAISHGGGGVTCQAEPVTITAHQSTAATEPPATLATGYTGTITLSTGTGRGDWSVVTGGGTLNNGAANDGIATYAFNATDGGVAVLGLKHTVAGAVNVNVSDGVAVENPAEDPPLNFADSGFRITDGAGNPALIPTQTAAVTSGTFGLQAVRTDTQTGACVGVFAPGADVSVDLAFQCVDPVTCQPGQLVTFTNNGVPGTIAGNPAAGVGSYTARTLRFGAASQALFTLAYPDVGAIRLHARHNIALGDGTPSGSLMTGASNAFVVKPAGFTLTNIVRTSDGFANPGASAASGPAFARAGEAFSATVTALNALSLPTPNYGKEIAPEGVTLTSNLVLPAGGANPAIGGASGFGAFANGAATGTAFSWGEVGIITLTPSVADGNYLGVGNVTGTATGNVGRFHPDHFELLAGAVLNPACASGGFSYMDHAAIGLAFSVEARNLAGLKTANYTGAFAPGLVPLAAENADSGVDLGARLAVPAGTWGNGTYTLSVANAVFARAAAPDGPFDALRIGARVSDPDGALLANPDMNPGTSGDCAAAGNCTARALAPPTRARFGRLHVENAHGSELLALPVRLAAQYWNGLGFVTNTLDDCSSVQPGHVALWNYQGNLASGETSVAGPVTLSGGTGTLVLSAPGAGNNGSVDLAINLGGVAAGNTCPAGMPDTTPSSQAHLRGRWCGTAHDRDPSARATFGVFRGPGPVIYMRENF